MTSLFFTFAILVSATLACTVDEFECANGDCIQDLGLVCNGNSDCLDDSDEAPMLCGTLGNQEILSGSKPPAKAGTEATHPCEDVCAGATGIATTICVTVIFDPATSSSELKLSLANACALEKLKCYVPAMVVVSGPTMGECADEIVKGDQSGIAAKAQVEAEMTCDECKDACRQFGSSFDSCVFSYCSAPCSGFASKAPKAQVEEMTCDECKNACRQFGSSFDSCVFSYCSAPCSGFASKAPKAQVEEMTCDECKNACRQFGSSFDSCVFSYCSAPCSGFASKAPKAQVEEMTCDECKNACRQFGSSFDSCVFSYCSAPCSGFASKAPKAQVEEMTCDECKNACRQFGSSFDSCVFSYCSAPCSGFASKAPKAQVEAMTCDECKDACRQFGSSFDSCVFSYCNAPCSGFASNVEEVAALPVKFATAEKKITTCFDAEGNERTGTWFEPNLRCRCTAQGEAACVRRADKPGIYANQMKTDSRNFRVESVQEVQESQASEEQASAPVLVIALAAVCVACVGLVAAIAVLTVKVSKRNQAGGMQRMV